jgi:hypothetical protein
VTGQKYRATNQKKQAKKYNFSLAFLFLCPYNGGEKWSEMEQSALKSHDIAAFVAHGRRRSR